MSSIYLELQFSTMNSVYSLRKFLINLIFELHFVSDM